MATPRRNSSRSVLSADRHSLFDIERSTSEIALPLLAAGRPASRDLSEWQQPVHADAVTTPKATATATLAPTIANSEVPSPAKAQAKFTDDTVSLFAGLAVYAAAAIISAFYSSPAEIESNYITIIELVLPIAVVYFTGWMLKETALRDYFLVMALTILAKAIGAIPVFASNGVGAPLWAILIGLISRFIPDMKLPIKAEYFIKVGVILSTINIQQVATLGAAGLLVSVLDTMLLLCIFCLVVYKWWPDKMREYTLIIGGTTICGSSAVTAIASTIDDKNDPISKDNINLAIALIGVLNIPLIPLLPIARSWASPSVLGGWIGGAVDSTGPVIACASIAGAQVLQTAIVVKMAQNLLIGPICLGMAIIKDRKFTPMVIVDKFPRFVIGFIVTSLITSYAGSLGPALHDNAFFLSEWFSLIGFTLIGLETDVMKLVKSRKNLAMIALYLVVQTVDLGTTLGWSVLAFDKLL